LAFVHPRRSLLLCLGCAGALTLVGCGKRSATIVEPSEDTASANEGEPSAGSAADDELAQVCAHSYEVLIVPTGAASPGVRSDFMTNCREGAEAKREALGDAAWNERVRCILAGHGPDDLGRCDGREPQPAKPQHSNAEGISIAPLCDKFLDLINKEFGGALISESERENFKRGCIEQFEQARAEDPSGFEREARCLLDAESVQELQACGS
jgi:hypothetical protein